ncbi:MAG: S8 family serine peptidase [Scytonema sp. PMC 1069.18]|nr:S8 family serine peptidase [Scytonema sp. PMC 1069.18]MEC4884134.1 S8 family serine peptidase [Scytonema sp. PMC 1070.18]
MHNFNQSATVNSLGPSFEGFTIEMKEPIQEDDMRELVYREIGTHWQINSFGHQTTVGKTQFEVIPQQATLSVKEAWEMTYRLRGLPEVEYAEPLFTVAISHSPDWSDQPAQMANEASVNKTNEVELERRTFAIKAQPSDKTDDPLWMHKQIQVLEVWERFFPDPRKPPGHGVVIGLPDTGYTLHPEVIPNLLIHKGYDFLKGDNDPLDELETPFGVLIPNPGHGTFAGSIAISPRNNPTNDPSVKTVTGIAPGSKLIPIRIAYSVVQVNMLNLAKGIEYAVEQGAHVISVSLGGLSSRRLHEAIAYAQKQGVIITAAVGNFVPFVVFPAAYDEVIAVGASNINKEVWVGSSPGSEVDIAAPGEEVWFALPERKEDGNIEYRVKKGTGTSLCTPIVAGIAALWLSYHGRENLIQRYGAENIPIIFQRIIRNNCDTVPGWNTGRFGAGIVNAKKVLEAELPRNVNNFLMATAFQRQEDILTTSNQLKPFVHLFEQSLPEVPVETRDAGIIENPLKTKLAELLQISEAELPSRLQEVGEELAFYFAVEPELYKEFAALLSQETTQSAQLRQLSFAMRSPNSMDTVRSHLLSKGVSESLATILPGEKLS